VLVEDVCFRPPITIRSHDLHVSDIKKVVGEITSTTKGTSFLPSLVLTSYTSFGLSLALPFVFHVMVPTIGFYYDPSFLLSNIITIPNEIQYAHFSSTQKMIINFHLAYRIVWSIKT